MTPEVFVSSSLAEAAKIALAIGAGAGVKIFYDWFMADRIYMTIDACSKNQRTCEEMVSIRKDFTEYKAIMSQRMAQLDIQMAEGHANFKEISSSLSCIKTNIAVISAWIEREHK